MTNATLPLRFRNPFDPEPWATPTVRLAPELRRDTALLERLRAAHFEGDTLADDLVEWMYSVGLRDGRRAFEQAVEHGVGSLSEPSAPLASFFASVDAVPAWLDRGQLERASRAATRAAIGGGYVLFSLSLLSGYVSAGITKTLARTGALETMAPRRLAETAKFVDDVYRSRTLERANDGFKTTLRVRVMHALVRRQLLRSGWDVERWGLPINQADMALTVLQFSTTFVIGLRMLGHIVPKKDGQAMTHLWRYVGRLSGVAEDLLPATEEEGRRMLRLLAASQQGPDADGRALARALLAAPAEQLAEAGYPRWAIRADAAFRAGFARFALGATAADALGLPDTRWKYAPFVVAPVVFATEVARCATPFATPLAEYFGRRLADDRMRRLLGGRAPTFVPRGAGAE